MMLDAWADAQGLPKGVGIDCVRISWLQGLDSRLGGQLVGRAFTPGERALAETAGNYWEFLAGRFAVKEAVFKALSCERPNPFDFRQVETLRREDGCPQLNLASIPREAMEKAGARSLLVSITGEGDYAIALVLASGEDTTKIDKST